jgi:hypothetical protein
MVASRNTLADSRNVYKTSIGYQTDQNAVKGRPEVDVSENLMFFGLPEPVKTTDSDRQKDSPKPDRISVMNETRGWATGSRWGPKFRRQAVFSGNPLLVYPIAEECTC